MLYNRNEQHPYLTATIPNGKIDGVWHHKTIRLNRFIVNATDKRFTVDHINHNTLDNRKCNLRITKPKENSQNRTSCNKNNSLGIRNVFYNKNIKKKPYVVQLHINGKNKIMGNFENVEDAKECATSMREKYYGEFAGAG